MAKPVKKINIGMISFKIFLLEGSRSNRRLLRKILSKDTSPEQVQDLTTADHYRTQFRDIIKNKRT
jgi:hypothetical protein